MKTVYRDFVGTAPIGQADQVRIQLFKEATKYAKDNALKFGTLSSSTAPQSASMEFIVLRVSFIHG